MDQIRSVDQRIAGFAKGFQSGVRSGKALESGQHKAHPSVNRYCRAQIQGYIYDFLMKAAGCVFSASCRACRIRMNRMQVEGSTKGQQTKQTSAVQCGYRAMPESVPQKLLPTYSDRYRCALLLRHQIGTLEFIVKSAVNRGPEVFDDSK
jgi:hypothetical protein